MMDESEILDDVVLVLLYMFSWKEKVADDFWVARAWKGFSFDVLDSLERKGYISNSHKAKSVVIKDEGLERAIKLKDEMFSALKSIYESNKKTS